MASNLDYLDPTLIPLEEKVKAYLEAEESLRQASLAATNEPLAAAEASRAAQSFDQRSAAGSFNQPHDDITQRFQAMRDDLAALHSELLALLPVRDEWVKVNLGYGPSRVGAWHVPATETAAEHYQVRVVH
jgi:hypothetical protein